MATYEEMTRSILSNDYILEILDKSNLSDEDKYTLVHSIVTDFSGIKRNSKHIYNNSSLPSKYISFDIETTGFSYNDRMIQIAGVKYEDGNETGTFMSYVNPGDFEIPTPISYLTGVTPQHVSDAPSIDVAVKKFLEFTEDIPLIGHNIFSFEVPRFLRWANVDLSRRIAVDTLNFAQEMPINVENYKLETLKSYYGISNRSHDALEDSRTTALIYEFLKNGVYTPTSKNENIKPIFEGKTFCYSGAFRMSRKSIEAAIISRGGKIQKKISKRVDYFINAPQIAKNLTDGKRSRKEIDFDQLVSEGILIKKITEDEFISMLEE